MITAKIIREEDGYNEEELTEEELELLINNLKEL